MRTCALAGTRVPWRGTRHSTARRNVTRTVATPLRPPRDAPRAARRTHLDCMMATARAFAVTTALVLACVLLLASPRGVRSDDTPLALVPTPDSDTGDVDAGADSAAAAVTQPVVETSDVLFTNADTTIFEPTDDWKEGLEIRMDLAAGKKWARKLQPSPPPPPRRKSAKRVAAEAAAAAEAATPSAVTAPALAPADASADASGSASAPAVAAAAEQVVLTAPASEAADDGDHGGAEDNEGLSAADYERAETEKRILASLPMPEPELVEALGNKRMSKAAMARLLDRLWKKRQAELQEAMAALQTDATVMQKLLARVMAAAAYAQGQPVGEAIEGMAQPPVGASPEMVAAWYSEDMIQALEDLEYHVTDVDNAVDFASMGGLTVMGQLLQSYTNSQVRRLAAWVIGNAVKYNVHVQREAVTSGLLRQLLAQLNHTAAGAADTDPDVGPAVAGKLLYAISALLRGSPFAQVQFAALDGTTLLLQLLHQPTASGGQWRRVAAKAAALLGDLSAEVRDRAGTAEAPATGAGAAGSSNGAEEVEIVQLDHKTRAVHSVTGGGAGGAGSTTSDLAEAVHTRPVCEALVEALDAAQAHVDAGVAVETTSAGTPAAQAGRQLRQALQWRDQIAHAVVTTARDGGCVATYASPPVRSVLQAVVSRVEDGAARRAQASGAGGEGGDGDASASVATLLRGVAAAVAAS